MDNSTSSKVVDPVQLESSQIDYDISFKVILVGDSNVGKTCLALKAAQDKFKENYYSTVAFEFCNISYRINNEVVKLQVWDTCGQEIYKSLIANFYKSSSLAIAVFSVERYSSKQ